MKQMIQNPKALKRKMMQMKEANTNQVRVVIKKRKGEIKMLRKKNHVMNAAKEEGRVMIKKTIGKIKKTNPGKVVELVEVKMKNMQVFNLVNFFFEIIFLQQAIMYIIGGNV